MREGVIDREQLLLQIHDLSLQLEEAQDALRAIRSGEVDALVIHNGEQDRIYTLHEADQIYRQLVESLTEGALIFDESLMILFANPAFAVWAGVPNGRLIGQTFAPLLALSDRPTLINLVETARAQGFGKGEISPLLATDPAARALVSISRIAISGSDPIFVGVVTDVTALRAAQQGLQNARDGLEMLVDARTEELRRANAALAEAGRKKDEFLAMLAHELRNPLAPIRNAAQILQRVSGTLPTMQKPVDIIQRQVLHLSRLVDDLLDVARLTQGKITLQKRPVDLRPILVQVVDNHRGFLEDCDHELRVDLAAEALWVFGDEVRLTQIVANLLSNACKYTPSHGEIGITAQAADGYAVVTVSDNGIGIAPEALVEIFDLFAQIDPGLDRAHGGLGIGLCLVRNLAQRHGGTIEAFSEGLGRGSEFRLRLPLYTDAPDDGRSEMPAASESRQLS